MSEYLVHHGIKGQKWGVRRYQNEDGTWTSAGKNRYETSDVKNKVKNTKAAYKEAKKQYNKDFNKAYNRSGIHLTEKGRKADTERWEKVYDSSNKLAKAKTDYRNAKTARKNAIDKAKNQIDKKTTLGDRLVYNDATRKLAAKYVVDNNMTVDEANRRAKSAANRNTAIFVAGYATLMAASIAYDRNH